MESVDVDMMVKAISNGSGGSTQFGIRAPMMVHRKFRLGWLATRPCHTTSA